MSTTIELAQVNRLTELVLPALPIQPLMVNGATHREVVKQRQQAIYLVLRECRECDISTDAREDAYRVLTHCSRLSDFCLNVHDVVHGNELTTDVLERVASCAVELLEVSIRPYDRIYAQTFAADTLYVIASALHATEPEWSERVVAQLGLNESLSDVGPESFGRRYYNVL